MFKMLHGDLYWHDAIRRVLASVGLIRRRIERMESHPVWLLWLTRTTFNLECAEMVCRCRNYPARV